MKKHFLLYSVFRTMNQGKQVSYDQRFPMIIVTAHLHLDLEKMAMGGSA